MDERKEDSIAMAMAMAIPIAIGMGWEIWSAGKLAREMVAEQSETQWIINAEYRPNYAFWTGARLTMDKPTGSLRKIEVDDPRSGGRMAILEVTEFEVLDQVEPALFHYAPPAHATVRDATGE